MTTCPWCDPNAPTDGLLCRHHWDEAHNYFDAMEATDA